MLQDKAVGVFAPAWAERAGAAVALASFVPAGGTARLLSSYGTVGPRPGNYEALIRDRADESRRALGSYKIASVSTPAPGALVVEARVGSAGHLPAAVSIGWVVRTTGTGKLWLGGLIPTLRDVNTTYYWLLRDGQVKAHLLNGHEACDRGRRRIVPLEAAVENGHVRLVS